MATIRGGRRVALRDSCEHVDRIAGAPAATADHLEALVPVSCHRQAYQGVDSVILARVCIMNRDLAEFTAGRGLR